MALYAHLIWNYFSTDSWNASVKLSVMGKVVYFVFLVFCRCRWIRTYSYVWLWKMYQDWLAPMWPKGKFWCKILIKLYSLRAIDSPLLFFCPQIRTRWKGTQETRVASTLLNTQQPFCTCTNDYIICWKRCLEIIKCTKILASNRGKIAFVSYSFSCSIIYWFMMIDDAWAPLQYQIKRLIVRSGKVSKPGDLTLELSDRSEIWHAPRLPTCLSNFKLTISRLRYFTRSCDEMSYRISKRDHVLGSIFCYPNQHC